MRLVTLHYSFQGWNYVRLHYIRMNWLRCKNAQRSKLMYRIFILAIDHEEFILKMREQEEIVPTRNPELQKTCESANHCRSVLLKNNVSDRSWSKNWRPIVLVTGSWSVGQSAGRLSVAETEEAANESLARCRLTAHASPATSMRPLYRHWHSIGLNLQSKAANYLPIIAIVAKVVSENNRHLCITVTHW